MGDGAETVRYEGFFIMLMICAWEPMGAQDSLGGVVFGAMIRAGEEMAKVIVAASVAQELK
jgi:hypothetical protein